MTVLDELGCVLLTLKAVDAIYSKGNVAKGATVMNKILVLSSKMS